MLGDRTYVSVLWMCEKETAASLNNTEAEVVSLGAGLRMEEFAALMLWACVVDVCFTPSTFSCWATSVGRPHSVDDVPHNIENSNQRACSVDVCQDNEAII